jgi:hypothetical protein
VRRFGRQPYDPVQHLRASVGTISTHDGEIWRVEHTTVNRLGATHERFAVFRGRVEILAHESVVMELAARAAVAQLWALRSNVGLGGGARRSAQA